MKRTPKTKTAYKILLSVLFTLSCMCNIHAQDSTNLFNRLLQSPDNFIGSINKKVDSYENKLLKKTEKYLKKIERQERKLQRQLAKKDSVAAKQLFGNTQAEYQALQDKLKSKTGTITNKLRSVYSGRLDSLTTALNFLNKAGNMSNLNIAKQKEITDAIAKLKGLQGKLNSTEDIKKYIDQRKKLLQEQLEKYGLTKQLRKFQKEAYYYQAQVAEYKQMFDDPSKIEAKALDLLKKVPEFKEYFAQNSAIASMFSNTGVNALQANFAGLQTRDGMSNLFEKQFGSGSNVIQIIRQNIGEAKGQLNQLKDKIISNSFTNTKGGGVDGIPNFKPNQQKTKPFLKRLEYTSNLQSVKSNSYFPTTSDIALSVGYKLNDKSIIGIGASYKLGLGKGIDNIKLSNEGIGFRSFVDYKIKGGFWLSGGAEMNYRNSFNSINTLQKFSNWQSSALLGLTKKYKVSKKFKGNIQFMYDFLYKQHLPISQPFVYRVGYSFK